MEHKTDRTTSGTLPPAVVLGCSHDNRGCTHERHPSRDYFYTVDIREDIRPDLAMDITCPRIPDDLKKRFKLTILEYMPCDTYNRDKGFANIREMTDDDGFILVVGSGRDIRYRHSLATLNYLEFAVADEDSYILLIPNNQSLSVEQVNEQLASLPEPLQQAIKQTDGGYRLLNPTQYCRLNYQKSQHNKALIDDLSSYIESRAFGAKYSTRLNLFGTPFNFGYSRDEKIEAARALSEVLLGNKPVSSLTKHAGSLANGRLSAILEKHLNGRSLGDFIDSPLKRRAERGEKFFYTPDSAGQAYFSCGDGRVYKGTLRDIHRQLEDALKKDPESANLSSELREINRVLLANPSLACLGAGGAASRPSIIDDDSPATPLIPKRG